MNACKSPRSRVAAHVDCVPKSGIRVFFDIVVKMKDVISLGIGEPDFVTPWQIREQAIFGLEKGHTAYTANAGKLSLRRAICAYAAENFQTVYDPEGECLVTVGVSEALDLVLRTIIEPGDEIIYHEPSYVAYPAEIAFAHGVPVRVPCSEENGFLIDPAALERAITPKTRALLLNNPCNPTGAVFPEPLLRAIADIAIKHDLLVITDEIYAELTYTERPSCIASYPGMKDRTILLHGFSKAFAMTGLRLGYMCGPRDIIAGATKIHQYAMMCASTLAQEAGEEALKHGHDAMESMRQSYFTRRNYMVNAFNRIGLPCRMPEGAFYVFPRIEKTGLTDTEFAIRLLEEQRVALVPGSAFGSAGAGHVRCSYATSQAALETAMARIEIFLKSLNNKPQGE